MDDNSIQIPHHSPDDIIRIWACKRPSRRDALQYKVRMSLWRLWLRILRAIGLGDQ